MAFRILAVTGHRPDKLGGYGDKAQAIVREVATRSLDHIKPDMVYTGMALGWDQAVAKAAIELKIPFIAAVPFYGQQNAWPESSQVIYRQLLHQAADVVVVTESDEYRPEYMQRRNQFMVDASNMLLALWNPEEKRGGTFNCIRYAESTKKGSGYHIYRAWALYAHLSK